MIAFFENDEYIDEKFVGLNLANADFTGKSFSDCVFVKCDLSLARFVNASLRGVRFESCKLIGVNFTKCSANFLEIQFDASLIDTCNFAGLKLMKAQITHCVVRDCTFVESDLRGSNFAGSDLSRTGFHRANLQLADLRTAKNYAIDPTATKVKGARFSLPEAVSLLSSLEIELDNG